MSKVAEKTKEKVIEELKAEVKYLSSKEAYSMKDFIELKRILKSVDNTITYLTTVEFLDIYLKDMPCLGDIKKDINETSPNTNGYDIESKDLKLIAEVKCNIPVNKSTFGANQIKGIYEDINGLKNPENKKTAKHAKSPDIYKDYRKVMIFLLCGNSKDHVKNAVSDLIKRKYQDQDIFDYDSTDYNSLKEGKINIVFIDLGYFEE